MSILGPISGLTPNWGGGVLADIDFRKGYIPQEVESALSTPHTTKVSAWTSEGKITEVVPNAPVLDFCTHTKNYGLLMEGPSINGSNNIGDYLNPTGVPIGMGTTQTPTLGPDGLMSAVRIHGTRTGRPFSQTLSATQTAVTVTVIAADDPQGDGRLAIQVRNNTAATNFTSAVFDIRNNKVIYGNIANEQIAQIRDHGEWKELIVTRYAGITAGDFVGYYCPAEANGPVNPIRIWRGQLESGGISTSLIQPGSTPVARTATPFAIDLTKFGGFGDGMAFFMDVAYESSFTNAVRYSRIGVISDTNNRMELFIPNGTSSQAKVVNAQPSSTANISSAVAENIGANRVLIQRFLNEKPRSGYNGKFFESSSASPQPPNYSSFRGDSSSSYRTWLHRLVISRTNFTEDQIKAMTNL